MSCANALVVCLRSFRSRFGGLIDKYHMRAPSLCFSRSRCWFGCSA